MIPASVRGLLLADRYELERELSADSQAAEWQAHDTTLDRRVVVRLLQPELARDAHQVERFWDAARAAVRGSTADQPQILDGGTDAASGLVFLVREWRDPLGAAGPANGPYASVGAASAPAPAPAPAPAVAVAVEGQGATRQVHPVPASEAAPVAAVVRHGVPRRRTEPRGGRGWPLARGHVLALGLVVALAVIGAIVGANANAWLAWVNEPVGRTGSGLSLGRAAAVPSAGAQPGQATSVPRTPPPTLAPAARPAADAQTPAPTATVGTGTSSGISSAGEPRRVANTDGLGVALRASPGGDRQSGRGYPEGAIVTVFEQQGDYARIRGTDGREGWVLAVTLVPTDGTAAPGAGTPAPPAATAASSAQRSPTVAAMPGGQAPATPAIQAPATPAIRTPATPATQSGPASGRQRVVNTEGLGVALRTAPDGERLNAKGYDEGALVTVLEQNGPWTHIRGDDGRDGWVPTVTLGPA